MMKYPAFVKEAIALDRDLAAEFAPKIESPPPVKTFLSFAAAGVFPDLVQICLDVIPPEEWVLLPTDGELLNSLPQSEKYGEIIRRAIVKLPAEVVTESGRIHRERSFVFEPVRPVEIDEKIREHEPVTVAHLKAFLWHTGGHLPFAAERLEEIVYEHSSDRQLLIGFFYWAQQNRCQISLDKWGNRIHLTRFDLDEVHVVAALLMHAQQPFGTLPFPLRQMIHQCFVILNCPSMDRSSVYTLLRSNQGITWFFARNYVRSDIELWRSTPLLIARATSDTELMKESLSGSPSASFAFDLLGPLSDIFTVPCHNELCPPMRVPTCYGVPYQFYPVKYEESVPKPTKVNPDLINKVLSVLEHSKNVPFEYFHFFSLVDLTTQQVGRCREALKLERNRRRTSYKYRLPALYDFGERTSIASWNGHLESDIEQFFTGKPPSFTRSFCRSLLSQIIPPIRSEFLTKLMPILTPVFPALAYGQMSYYGLRASKEASPLSLLRLGYLPTNAADLLQYDLRQCSWESIATLEALLRLDYTSLKVVIPWVLTQDNRDHLILKVLQSAAGAGSTIAFAKQVFQFMKRHLNLPVMMTMICSTEFLASENFPCVLYVFKAFEMMVRRAGSKDIYEYCQVFHSPATGCFGDQFRHATFASLANPETIALVLRGPPDTGV
jgi:hypothetical protein